jgi:hypothetical protein
MTMKSILTIILFCFSQGLPAQRYLDIAKISGGFSPITGMGEKRDSIKNHFFSVNLTIPIELKRGGDAIVINPFFEDHQGEISNVNFHVSSQGSMLGFLKKDVFENWDVLSGLIVRRNKEVGRKTEDNWQYGGVVLATWKRNQFAALKFGLYYNREFFGNYFMPLVGIDWKINSSNNLFGVLPGKMTFEHKVNRRFYYGINFRALTNSYRRQTIDPCFGGDCSAKNYLKVEDNQLGIFGDLYVVKNIALSPELGYTILRKYRYGYKGKSLHHYTDYRSDNFYFRIQLAYRIPLSQR